MPRFKVKLYGQKGHIAVVQAANGDAARKLVAASRKIDPGDLDYSRIEERVAQKCGGCGDVFKGQQYEYQLKDPDRWVRCPICKQKGAVAANYQRLKASQEKLDRMLAAKFARKAGNK